MDELVYEVDTTAWFDKVTQLAAATDACMLEVFEEEWPLLIRRIIDFTPPKTLAQGRAAVARDVQKTMRPFDPSAVRSKSIQKIVDERNIEAFNIVAGRARGGYLKNARVVKFAPEVHTDERDACGRVTSSYRNVRVLGSDAALLKRYMKSVQDHVGVAKAGWLPALHLFGQVGPSFAERQEARGVVIDRRSDAENMSVTAINRTPLAVRQDEGRRIVQDAVYSRAYAVFEKTKVKLRLAAKRAKLDNA